MNGYFLVGLTVIWAIVIQASPHWNRTISGTEDNSSHHCDPACTNGTRCLVDGQGVALCRPVIRTCDRHATERSRHRGRHRSEVGQQAGDQFRCPDQQECELQWSDCSNSPCLPERHCIPKGQSPCKRVRCRRGHLCVNNNGNGTCIQIH